LKREEEENKEKEKESVCIVFREWDPSMEEIYKVEFLNMRRLNPSTSASVPRTVALWLGCALHNSSSTSYHPMFDL